MSIEAHLARELRGLVLSTPRDGTFDITSADIEFKTLELHKGMENVRLLCVPLDRVADLIKGEELRGLCNLLKHEEKKDADGAVVGATYLCSRGKERKRLHQEKAEGAPQLQTSKCNRRSKIDLQQSSKLGCCYRLRWQQWAVNGQVAAAVIVNNNGLHIPEGSSTPCHGPGAPASTAAGQKLTEQCKDFVWQEAALRNSSNEQIILRARQILPCVLPCLHLKSLQCL
jgi:hypothetical protein